MLWTRSYGDKAGVSPLLLQIGADSSGNFVIAGQTGRGPTYLGGKPIYTGWPRGVGEAFVAKYDRAGAFQWSRELFPTTAEERKRGARSSMRSMSVANGGDVFVFASRVSSADDGSYLVSVSEDGRLVLPHKVGGGLPTLISLSVLDGTTSALGVEEDRSRRAAGVVSYRIGRDGRLEERRIGSVPQPPGTVNTQRVRVHPLGLLYTAVLDRKSAGATGGNLVCPIVDTRGAQDGNLVRNVAPPRPTECPWPATELLVAALDSDGKMVWARSFSVPNYEPGSETIATDDHGNTYLAGAFTGAAEFGALEACASVLPEGYVDDYFGGVEWDSPCECTRDYADVFVLKIDRNGTPAWVRRVGGFMRDRVGAVVVDSLGNPVVAVGSTPVPDFSVPRRAPLPASWSLHAYDPEGEHLWTHRLATATTPLVTAGAEGAVVVAESSENPSGIRLTAVQSWPRMP